MDPNDGVALRSYFESLKGTLSGDRSTWDGHWKQLAAFFAPRSTRWVASDVNQGQRKDYDIINETGLLALRTLAAGMLTGMASQTRPWFRLQSDNPELNKLQDVRGWFQEVENKLREVFLKSNTYQSLLTLFGEEGLYGTSAFLIMEDDRTVIRCQPYPIGSFYLMQDDTLRIDGAIRTVSMTVRQIVERFGYENCSAAIQVQYDSASGGVKETNFNIVHVITKGSYFDPKSYEPPMPWVSVWYEEGSFNPKKGILRRSGFLENPLICGRWKVTGENIYAESPAMDCLGSVMSLQCWEERTAEATEKQFKPTLVASSDLDMRKFTTLPGDIMWADTKDVRGLVEQAYKVDFRIDGALAQIQRIEARINDAMYRSLFQMFSDSDRTDVTAAEINAKLQEKMQVLGPVVERNVEEVLAPTVKRTLSIMQRKGMLPTMPDALKGQVFKLEFISILAQAQRLGGINSLGGFMGFVGSQVAIVPDILDNVDTDASVREYAELSGLKAEILRTPEDVDAIRQGRQQAQAAQQASIAADNAQKLAGAARNLSEAHVGTGSLLDQALPSLVGR
ncbi:MAG: portal protein [Pseudomonadota bacterium]